MVLYDDEFEEMENKITTKDKFEPVDRQHIHYTTNIREHLSFPKGTRNARQDTFHYLSKVAHVFLFSLQYFVQFLPNSFVVIHGVKNKEKMNGMIFNYCHFHLSSG